MGQFYDQFYDQFYQFYPVLSSGASLHPLQVVAGGAQAACARFGSAGADLPDWQPSDLPTYRPADLPPFRLAELPTC